MNQSIINTREVNDILRRLSNLENDVVNLHEILKANGIRSYRCHSCGKIHAPQLLCYTLPLMGKTKQHLVFGAKSSLSAEGISLSVNNEVRFYCVQCLEKIYFEEEDFFCDEEYEVALYVLAAWFAHYRYLYHRDLNQLPKECFDKWDVLISQSDIKEKINQMLL